jgi:hypothetical protein
MKVRTDWRQCATKLALLCEGCRFSVAPEGSREPGHARLAHARPMCQLSWTSTYSSASCRAGGPHSHSGRYLSDILVWKLKSATLTEWPAPEEHTLPLKTHSSLLQKRKKHYWDQHSWAAKLLQVPVHHWAHVPPVTVDPKSSPEV